MNFDPAPILGISMALIPVIGGLYFNTKMNQKISEDNARIAFEKKRDEAVKERARQALLEEADAKSDCAIFCRHVAGQQESVSLENITIGPLSGSLYLEAFSRFCCKRCGKYASCKIKDNKEIVYKQVEGVFKERNQVVRDGKIAAIMQTYK